MAAYGTPIPSGGHPPGERSQVKLGRYEVVRELGKGAMGIVYLAKDPLIGRLVALKTIRIQNSDDDEAKEFQQRFVREAQAAGILNHPSIVTVHDIGQDDTSGVSFIAMEYVEGHNLKEVLSQGRPIGFEQIGEIIAQVAEALDFAHAKGIVHRDVKPANIILLDSMRAKITDFGIAKITSGGNLTTTGQFLGTPNYMAPEQIKGAPVDGRTDIFSLGICLYECLTKRKPFGGDSLTSISYKIVHEDFPPLYEINPQIPDGYGEVVAQCLAKDPAKRYQRGKDLAAALRAVIRGERPVKTEPLLAEITLVTRDRERLPTMEVPFPEAGTPPPAPQPMDTNPQPRVLPAPAPKPARPRVAPREILRKTLTGVRAFPLWKRRMPPAIFFGIVAVLALLTVGAVFSIKRRFAAPATVDVRVEKQRARERQLRNEANELLRQGRVIDAHQKFTELNRLAPQSPYVAGLLQRLSQSMRQVESGKAKLVLARQKFDQGLALYNEKKYTEAIPLLSESFSLDPNFEDSANYLKLAQQEEARERAKLRAAQQQKQAQKTTPATSTARTPNTAAPVPQPQAQPAAPTSLTVVVNHPFADGSITVKAGVDVVAREILWQETRFLKRREPRKINVTNQFPAKNADLEIWVEVPSQKIKEYHVMQRQNFQAGVNHKLTVSFNPASKTFEYSLN